MDPCVSGHNQPVDLLGSSSPKNKKFFVLVFFLQIGGIMAFGQDPIVMLDIEHFYLHLYGDSKMIFGPKTKLLWALELLFGSKLIENV